MSNSLYLALFPCHPSRSAPPPKISHNAACSNHHHYPSRSYPAPRTSARYKLWGEGTGIQSTTNKQTNWVIVSHMSQRGVRGANSYATPVTQGPILAVAVPRQFLGRSIGREGPSEPRNRGVKSFPHTPVTMLAQTHHRHSPVSIHLCVGLTTGSRVQLYRRIFPCYNGPISNPCPCKAFYTVTKDMKGRCRISLPDTLSRSIAPPSVQRLTAQRTIAPLLDVLKVEGQQS